MTTTKFFLAAMIAICASQQMTISFNDIDLNSNGALSVTELEAYCRLMDTNVDGSINFREFSLDNATLAQDAMLRTQFAYYDEISGVKDDRINCHDDSYTIFGKLDVDINGKISAQEYTNAVTQIRADVIANLAVMPTPLVGK